VGEATTGPVTPPPHQRRLLHRLEQVPDLVVPDINVGIARDTEERGGGHLPAGKQIAGTRNDRIVQPRRPHASLIARHRDEPR